MNQLKQKPDAMNLNGRRTTKSENLSDRNDDLTQLTKIDGSIMQVLYTKPNNI
jgi:hypothetical protein